MYKMATPSKTKSHFQQLLSKIDARRIGEIYQKLCIFSNQDQIKINLSVKTEVALNFMCSIIKILHLKYCPVCNA